MWAPIANLAMTSTFRLVTSANSRCSAGRVHPLEEEAGYIIHDPGGLVIKADIVDRVVDLAQIPRAKAATAVETILQVLHDEPDDASIHFILG